MTLAVAVVLSAGCNQGTARSPSSSPPTTVNTLTTASPSPTASATELAAPKPPIVWKPIPFPDSRKQEMRAYAQEHYGLDTFELVDPKVIVEHFTASTTFDPVFNTFAVDAPHLGERPGTCAHFVIDTDGTIYQLVPLDLMCRHTVGLNYTSIGIEMVGQSDQDILGNPPQLAAALDLTVWLMQRFRIELRNVIGHNESLTSPFHHELVASFRCQTHQDWNHADMEVFRRDLARMATTFDVPLGPSPEPVATDC
jgi:N-acetylmuramoyl-L-alanine amidase